MFFFQIDERLGIARGVLSGILTLDDAIRFRAESQRCAMALRTISTPMLMIVDSREAEIPSRELLTSFSGFSEGLIKTDKDRIAIILNSSFRKKATSEVHRSAQIKTFISPTAAELWLLAYAQDMMLRRSA